MVLINYPGCLEIQDNKKTELLRRLIISSPVFTIVIGNNWIAILILFTSFGNLKLTDYLL
jgi:hypothetical protein